MAQVLLYHHIQGLTPGVQAFADELRADGHTVHTPDLFEGHTFGSIEEGFAFARETGFDVLRERGVAVASELEGGLVYAGLSFGVTIAQALAQTEPSAQGALLLHSCLPLSEFGSAWPEGVPVQIHGMEGDEFFDEDLPAARELAESTPAAELFVYPGDQHLFTDSSLPAYDAEATALLLDRVREFLAAR
ncbi:Dienelactone hydrolase [Serinicoccus hydrothermalis]|uniref:Dienelactone hydrolase n=1 Tax=Serinicoccus hydrothermalis TaxID=1758689 RepID=A0A1B1NCA4_9MICO|nr:dienelactone hydrolase family protein [Serinicoccus hydrothermalis]ANS79090.1 Dienelactone hydrolase [Serinicoccus hydrothermalis]